MTHRQNLAENYGGPLLQWGNYGNTCGPDAFEDPHRCGTAPFVPNVSGPIQNSCGSYCDGFDKKTGCNKYKTNYPDDYYIADYIKQHGSCDGLYQECRECGDCPTIEQFSNLRENFCTMENFCMMPKGGLWTIIYIVFLILLARCMLIKK